MYESLFIRAVRYVTWKRDLPLSFWTICSKQLHVLIPIFWDMTPPQTCNTTVVNSQPRDFSNNSSDAMWRNVQATNKARSKRARSAGSQSFHQYAHSCAKHLWPQPETTWCQRPLTALTCQRPNLVNKNLRADNFADEAKHRATATTKKKMVFYCSPPSSSPLSWWAAEPGSSQDAFMKLLKSYMVAAEQPQDILCIKYDPVSPKISDGWCCVWCAIDTIHPISNPWDIKNDFGAVILKWNSFIMLLLVL